MERKLDQTAFRVFIHGMDEKDEVDIIEGEDLQLKCSAVSSVLLIMTHNDS